MQELDRELLRGARGVLGWSVADLAYHSGVSAPTISSFEQDAAGRRGSTLSQKTILKINAAFERFGVEITQDGIQKKDLRSFILKGDDANKQLLDDIFETLKDTGGEILIFGLSEPEPGNPNFEKVLSHIERLKKAGITERILIQKGDRNLVAPKEWYRWYRGKDFNAYPFQLYGSKIAMIDWGPPEKIVVVDHTHFAETYRVMFDALWEYGERVVISK
jgi:transcriptional regulator with XRE-family HTH domain